MAVTKLDWVTAYKAVTVCVTVVGVLDVGVWSNTGIVSVELGQAFLQ